MYFLRTVKWLKFHERIILKPFDICKEIIALPLLTHIHSHYNEVLSMLQVSEHCLDGTTTPRSQACPSSQLTSMVKSGTTTAGSWPGQGAHWPFSCCVWCDASWSGSLIQFRTKEFHLRVSDVYNESGSFLCVCVLCFCLLISIWKYIFSKDMATVERKPLPIKHFF